MRDTITPASANSLRSPIVRPSRSALRSITFIVSTAATSPRRPSSKEFAAATASSLKTARSPSMVSRMPAMPKG